MNKNETPRGKILIEIIKSESIVSLAKEYVEIGIDTALETGVLKDIPLVNSVVGICNFANTVRDQRLAEKIIRFLNELTAIPKEQITEMVNTLEGDDKFSGRTGTALIEILDRMESEKKPELAAKCFIAYANQLITYIELRRMLFALDRIPPFEIDTIKSFVTANYTQLNEMDEATSLAFVNAGLAKNNGGLDGGVIIPTALCELFFRSGILN